MERDMIAIVSDLQTAIQTVHNLTKGRPPRSHIESRIKRVLESSTQHIEIPWVRGHIGIEGNEKDKKRAAFESILVGISSKDRTATEEGVQAIPRATC